MKDKKTFVLVIASLIILVFGGLLFKGVGGSATKIGSGKVLAVIHKSPTCGCCLGHKGYLEGEGFSTEVVVENDISSFKAKYNIPYEYQSCHTAEIGGYFVEGHVPVEAINKLLTEKPDIDGISLPGMPAGSPGMPGVKKEEFVVYALKDGKASEFMRL